jgi:hypothetical protein
MLSDKVRVSGTISKDYKEKLEKILELENVNKGQFIEQLIDMYDEYQKLKEKSNEIQFGELSYNNIGLKIIHNQDGTIKENEIELVDKAIKNSGLSLKEIVKDGVLQRAKYLNSIAQNQAKLDSMSEEELKTQTFKGVANYRIEQAIEAIKSHNDKNTEKSDKICITKGVIFKITGSNRQTINKFFEAHYLMIEEHNNKHSLTDKDNRKGKNYDIKEILGI